MARWQFGNHELDSERFELRRGGRVVSAQTRLLKLLIDLAQNAHRVVPRGELMERVWAGVVVSDATMRNAIRDARGLLGTDQAFLRSVRGVGYQLCIDGSPPSNDVTTEPPAERTSSTDLKPLPVKITEPALGERIARTRLFEGLDAALSRRIVWIMGPAGAGKTTLVRTYVEAKGLPRIWYRVDDSDMDVASIFFYLRQALPAFGATAAAASLALPLLTPEYLAGLTTFARRYFDALFAELPRPCLMVFDNYQDVAADAAWHQVIRQAAESAPSGVHLVMVSRTGPHGSLARERAHDEMAVIGAEDLRLTADEALELARRHPSQLDTASVAELHKLSSGWAAGFTLLLNQAGWSKQRAPAVLLEQASQTIFDYFANELFERMPPDEQQFLLKTAVLPHMSEALAREVAGFDAAGRSLARLQLENLFIDCRDTSPPIYEYHPLFRQFLLDRAARALGDDVLEQLRKRAGQALCAQGEVEAGLELLLQASDWEGSVPWLLGAAPTLVGQGRARTLEAWITRLPAPLVNESGWLSYWNGICSLGHQPTHSVACLRRAFELMRDDGDRVGMHLAWAGVVRAIVFEGMRFAALDEWIDVYETIGAADPELPSVEVQAQVSSALLEALSVRAPASERTRQHARGALLLASRLNSTAERCAIFGALVHYRVLFGNLNEATPVLELLTRTLDADVEPVVKATVRLAQVSHAWAAGYNETCLNIVTAALHESKSAGAHVLDHFLCALGACATLALPNLDRARPFLETMAQGANRNRFSKGAYDLYASWQALLLGNTQSASSLLKVPLDEADVLGYPLARISARFAYCRVLTEAHQFDEALNHLADAKRRAVDCGSNLVLRGCLLAEADIAFSTAQPSKGVELVAEAVELGNKTGVANMFWMPHDVLRRLYRQAVAEGMSEPDLQNLIKPLGPDPR